LFYIDRSLGGATLSLPKEIRVNGKGELGAYYTDILNCIRINTLISPQNMPEIEDRMLLQTSFVLRTFGGVWRKEGTKYICKTEKYDFQVINFDMGAKSIEVDAASSLT
jgi:hypothetical protein